MRPDLLGLWTDTMWRATWQGSLFVIAVWIVCRLFKRLPASIRFWLWWIAGLQLLGRLLLLTPIALPILPATSAPAEASSQLEIEVLSPIAPAQTYAPAPPTPKLPLNAFVFAAWSLGLASCAGLGIKRLQATRRLLKDATPVTSPIALRLLLEVSSKAKVRPPALLESSAAPCALLTGMIRPKIVLPPSSAAAGEAAMAIAHEIAHLRRRDLWLATVPVLAQTIFFFNPLAWLVARETAAACEEICDLEALELSGGSVAAYARLLLNSAQSGAQLAAVGAAFRYRLLHRRITMLNSSKGSFTSRYRRAGTLLIALGALGALPWAVTAQVSKPSAKRVAHHKKKHAPSKAKHAATHVAPAAPLRTRLAVSRPLIAASPVALPAMALTTPRPPRALAGVAASAVVGAPIGVPPSAPAAAIRPLAGQTAPPLGGLGGGQPYQTGGFFPHSGAVQAAAPRGQGVLTTPAQVGGQGIGGGIAMSAPAHGLGGGIGEGVAQSGGIGGGGAAIPMPNQSGGIGGGGFSRATPAAAAGIGRGVPTPLPQATPSLGGLGGGGFGSNGFGRSAPAQTGGLGGGGFGRSTSGFGGGGFGGGSGGFGNPQSTTPSNQAAQGSAFIARARVVDNQVDHVAKAADNPNLRMNVKFRNVELVTALTRLLDAAEIDYVISPEVQSENVTCSLTNVTIPQALSTILKETHQHLTWRLEDHVYHITKRN